MKEGQLITASEFLSLFDGFHTLITKSDKEYTVPRHFCKTSLEECIQLLTWRNVPPNYDGVFFVVNEIDQDLDPTLNTRGFPRKRTKKMVSRIRAVFCDDDSSGGFRDDFPISPSIVLQSSAKNFQYFWLTSTTDFKEWDGVQNRIVTDWGGDKNAKDLARILRVPGFYHNKKDPFMVKAMLIKEKPYDWQEIVDNFEPLYWEPKMEVDEFGDAKPAIPRDSNQNTDILFLQLLDGDHIHGPCSALAQSYANFNKDFEYIWDEIYPTLKASEAKNSEHPRNPDWINAMEGGLKHDIESAVEKFRSGK